MAWLFKKGNSPFWYVGWKVDGREFQRSTKVRHGGKNWRENYSRAVEVRLEKTILENQQAALPGTGESAFVPLEEWVPGYLENRYSHNPKTAGRYLRAFKTFALYLAELEVVNPNEITRNMCLNYLGWRKRLGRRIKNVAAGDGVPVFVESKKPVKHNTCLMELKVLRSIFNFAVQEGFMRMNPASKLGVHKEAEREKDEVTDEKLQIIVDEIGRRRRLAEALRDPDERAGRMETVVFLERSFRIALHQACRLGETHICLDDINFEQREIFYRDAKGAKNFKAPIHPELFPFFEALREAGERETYRKPKMPSLKWMKFFGSLRKRHEGFEDISFHSLRVTGISRLARAGVSEVVCMRMVGHASTTVHRVYRKVTRSEIDQYWGALGMPKSS